MVFLPNLFSNSNVENFKLGVTRLKIDEEAVYLGHRICDNLEEDSDFNRYLRKLNNVGNVIIRKFDMCTPVVKRHLFRAQCSAVYCSSLWSSFTVMSL